MDPATCYLTILDALREHDYARAREYALILKAWLEGGGFFPKGATSHEVYSLLGRTLRPACSCSSLRFPFQAIRCTHCNALSGNANLQDAIDAGWFQIDIEPDAIHVSHAGMCPRCREHDDQHP